MVPRRMPLEVALRRMVDSRPPRVGVGWSEPCDAGSYGWVDWKSSSGDQINSSDATGGRDKLEGVGRATWANKFTEDPEPSDKSRKNIFTPIVRAVGEEKFCS